MCTVFSCGFSAEKNTRLRMIRNHKRQSILLYQNFHTSFLSSLPTCCETSGGKLEDRSPDFSHAHHEFVISLLVSVTPVGKFSAYLMCDTRIGNEGVMGVFSTGAHGNEILLEDLPLPTNICDCSRV